MIENLRITQQFTHNTYHAMIMSFDIYDIIALYDWAPCNDNEL